MKPIVEQSRITRGMGPSGAFFIPFERGLLRVISSTGGGWDHVSVCRIVDKVFDEKVPGNVRVPHYEELEFVRGLFFNDNECVMQLSVPRSEHVNRHPHVLHLWRPQDQPIPMPPKAMV